MDRMTTFTDFVFHMLVDDNPYECTLEFATSVRSLTKKKKILNELLSKLCLDDEFYWDVFPCSTCKEYHKNKPIHVLLEKIEFK